MKRIFFLASILLCALTSCALSPDKKQESASSAAPAEPSAEQISREVEASAQYSAPDSTTSAPSPSASKSQIVNATMESEILHATRDYTVYLPPSYASSPDRRYPILYLLHGMLDDNHCWVTRGGLQQVCDELIAQGKMVEMVIVTPCAGGKENKDWNGYFNMPGWNYEDFFFKEFMPKMESDYRVISDRGHRAAAGLSMGGGAATSYCQRYPDLFCACYAMSALMDIVPLPGSKAGPNSMVGKMSKSVKDLACPKFVREADAATLDKLRTIRWYVDCGNRDFLLKKNQEFMAAMEKAKVPFKRQIRKGTHSWQYWHSGLYICLPFISESFSKD